MENYDNWKTQTPDSYESNLSCCPECETLKPDYSFKVMRTTYWMKGKEVKIKQAICSDCYAELVSNRKAVQRNYMDTFLRISKNLKRVNGLNYTNVAINLNNAINEC